MTDVTVYKCDHQGVVKLSYPGTVLERGDGWVCIEAIFQHDSVDIGVVTFNRGDRMVEWFYADRYYNIFQLEDGNTRRIKGWYCNITRPATITEDRIAADDLALDVFFAPDGTMTVLDEDEFSAVLISDDEREHVKNAVTALQRRVTARKYPFDQIYDNTTT